MRVNPNPYPDLIADVSQTQQQINTDELQIGSGLAVNVPSDNPAAAAELIENASQTAQDDQFQRSIGSIQGEIQSADSTLSSVVTALQQAINLGVEGANGTVNASDRAAITTQIQGIQSQLLSLANLTYQGNYVFAGTANQTTPYVLDPNSTSGVTYQGNSGTNSVTLGNQFSLQINLPGSHLFFLLGRRRIPEHSGSDHQSRERHGDRHSGHRTGQCLQLRLGAKRVLRQCAEPVGLAADLPEQRYRTTRGAGQHGRGRRPAGRDQQLDHRTNFS